MSASLSCPHCGGQFVFRCQPLSRRQAELLTYIATYIDANGFAPSFDEMAEAFGYASLATIHEHLGNLERKGAIHRRYNESRGITVLVRPDELGALTIQSARVA